MVRLLGGCLCLILLAGCSGSTPAPTAPTPSNSVASAPATQPNQPSLPNPSATTGTPPATTGAPSPSKDGVTVITPQIVEEQLFSLHSKYPGQTLEVSGVVDSVSDFIDGRSMLYLKTGKDYSNAMCPFEEKEVWARCAPGQTVTLRGKPAKLDAFTTRVLWQVESAGVNPAPVITATALAKEFHDDDALASARYADQHFYLQGEIVSIEAEVCYLKTDSPIQIEVTLPPDAELSPNPFLKTAAYRVGQPLTVLAKYDPLLHEPGVIEVDARQVTVPFPVPGVKYAAAIPTARERLAKVEQAMRETKPAFQVTTAEIYTGWTTDKPALLEKYGDKIGDVTGTIEGFYTYAERNTDSLNLVLADNFLGLGMRCKLVTATPWKDYQVGQTITVRGRFDGSTFPDWVEAVVIASQPAAMPRVKLTVEELLQQVAAAGEFKRDTWRGREFLLTGPVLQVDLENTLTPLKLNGGPAGTIGVSFAWSDHLKVINLPKRQPGDKLTLIGEVTDWSPDEKTLELSRAWLIP